MIYGHMASEQRKTLKGVVVSSKMQGTVVVSVDRYVKHPKYGKYRRISKRYKVDSSGTSPEVGTRVVIASCRPISKEKFFRLVAPETKGV